MEHTKTGLEKNSEIELCNNDKEPTECLRAMWPFLQVSRILGLFPISKQGIHFDVPRTIWNIYWIPTIFGLASQFLLLVEAIYSTVEHILNGDVGDLVEDFNDFISYIQNVTVYIFLICRVRDIPEFLASFAKVEKLCRKYQIPGDRLVRDVWLLFALFFWAQMFEILLFYYSAATRSNATTLNEFIAIYNNDFFGKWSIEYSGLLFCCVGMYSDLCANFGDTMIGLLSFILTRYFIRINRGLRDGAVSLEKVDELRNDHQQISGLVQHCNEVFAVLFLVTYAGNVGFLLTRLYVSLQNDISSNGNPLVRLEGFYTFFNQIFIKILLPSHLAAKLNEEAHEGINILQDWPSLLDAPHCKHRLLMIERFIAQLEIPIGFSGCGYFLINKGFIVTLVSALITYEVIILQFQTAANAKMGLSL